MIADTFTQWQSRLVGFCTQILRNPHDAEEVVQEVFARLVAEPGRYDLGEAPEVLLFRLARHRCIDALRKRAPRSNTAVEPSVSEQADHEDLELALGQLPDVEREALLLTAVEGLGYREVAGILGCSLGTVAARRYAAIHKLRERLTP